MTAQPAATTLLGSAFPENRWVEEHAARAREAAGKIGDVIFELSMVFAEDQPLIGIQQLYQIAKSIPEQSASYQGKVYQDERWAARRGADDIYAVINFDVTKNFWYWAIRRNGDAYLAATIGSKSEAARLSIEEMLREFLAAVIHAREFAARFVAAPKRSPELLLRASVHGVAGRVLYGTDHRRAFPYHLEMYGYKTPLDRIDATIRTSVAALQTNFRGVVDVFCGDLAAYFNFLTVPADYLDYAVEAIDKRTAG